MLIEIVASKESPKVAENIEETKIATHVKMNVLH
jgi:hypothetical protein